jgi:hypothetical protein
LSDPNGVMGLIGRLEFEYESLVKIDGQRPMYMDRNKLIALVEEMGSALRKVVPYVETDLRGGIDPKTGLDDLTFGKVFEDSRKLGERYRYALWRGNLYDMASVHDVAFGFKRQAELDRKEREYEARVAESIAGGIRHLEVPSSARDLYDLCAGADMAKGNGAEIAGSAKNYFAGYRQGKIDREEREQADQWTPDELERIRNLKPGSIRAIHFAPAAGRMQSEKPISQLRIERQRNGGWMICGGDAYDHRVIPEVSGAFTSTADMLAALTDLLERDDEERKEQADG